MKRSTKKHDIELFLIFLFSGLTLPLMADTPKNEFFGYFENRFFLVNQRDIAWKDFNQKFEIGNYNRLRLMGTFAPATNVTLHAAVDLFTFQGIMKSPLGAPDSSQQPVAQGEWEKIDLDRAYVELGFKDFDITVGKQRVAMGVSYLWALLDIFNRINIFEPKEEKPGATACKVYIPIKNKSSITAVFAPGSNFSSSQSALSLKTQVANVDIGLTLMRWGARDATVWGLDLRGENVVGWWLEAGHFSSPSAKNWKLVFGLDYTFPLKRGLYWLNEFFYDSSGENDPARYDFEKLLSGERFTLGQTYLFSLLQYPFSEFLSATLIYIGNWGDGSSLINPLISYDVSQALTVSLGAYFPLGHSNREFSTRRQDIFFIWLKANF